MFVLWISVLSLDSYLVKYTFSTNQLHDFFLNTSWCRDQFNSWVSTAKLGSLFSITVGSIIKEFGEPVAFACVLNSSEAISSELSLSTDKELKRQANIFGLIY